MDLLVHCEWNRPGLENDHEYFPYNSLGDIPNVRVGLARRTFPADRVSPTDLQLLEHIEFEPLCKRHIHSTESCRSVSVSGPQRCY